MYFYELFLIPNEFMTIIEILEYIFCLMIIDADLILDLRDIELIPVVNKKRCCFFNIEGEYIYTQLPAFWKLKIRNDHDRLNQCPNRLLHKILDLLNQIHEYSDARSKSCIGFKRLRDLFGRLHQENRFDCSYCPIIEKEIQEYESDAIYIRDFYSGFREMSVEEYKKIIEPHVKYLKIILNQTRSLTIQDRIIRIVRDTYLEYKEDYIGAMMAGRPVEMIHQKFAHHLKAKLMALVTFISFKNIDFTEWFNSIFRFQVNLANTELQFDSAYKKKLFKHIFSLLYLVFPEDIHESIDPEILVFQDYKKKRLKVCIPDLMFYHPFLRGECFRQYSLHAGTHYGRNRVEPV